MTWIKLGKRKKSLSRNNHTSSKMVALSLLCISLLSIIALANSSTDIAPPLTTVTIFSRAGEVISPDENGWFNQKITLDISSKDTDSGIKEIIVTGDVSRTFTVTGGATTIYATVLPKPDLSDGIWIVNFSAIDNAGNKEQEKSKIIKINSSATIDTPTPCTSCDGGGGGSSGGGGGGGSSMEDFSNILFTEKVDFNLIKDKPVTQIFKSNNLVYELDVVDANNEDFVTFKVELLKGITKTTNKTPEGTVYKYLNIYSGSKRLKEASIRFKVNNSWMTDNYDIKLLRLVDGEWTPLETTRINKDDTYTYFEAKTTGFLSFVIVGKTTQPSVQARKMDAVTPTEIPQKIAALQAQSLEKKSPGFGGIFTAIGFLALYVFFRKGK